MELMEITNHKRNQEIYERACKSIAGGVMSNYKRDEGYQPIYVESVDGAWLIDYDGNRYLDYAISSGPDIFGHSNENFKAALKAQIDKMYTNCFSLMQIECAEKIKEIIPSAELVRFDTSGTAAVYNAIRVARGYTGKNMFVKFSAHYHGGVDYILGGIVKDPENPIVSEGFNVKDPFTIQCNTNGRAKGVLENCYMLEFNDLEALRNLFEKKADEIACVVMEPVNTNTNGCYPEPGYLEGVRELCTKYNVVLIFDEVLTGFRMGLSGAQGYFGVTPDMSTFAKAIGGGIPVSVYCGKKEIMDVCTKTEVLAVGTYNGHPLSCAAILATIAELEKDDGAIFKRIEKLGNMLKEGFLEAAKKNGVNIIVQGYPGALNVVFTKKDKIINNADSIEHADLLKTATFTTLMKERGIISNFRFCLTAAHTEDDIQYTIEAADDVFGLMVDLDLA
jgi:glutamate-1-semialdehyde 2,1-aminomutase